MQIIKRKNVKQNEPILHGFALTWDGIDATPCSTWDDVDGRDRGDFENSLQR